MINNVKKFDVYEKVKEACEGLDAVYEDYLIELVGLVGFHYLKANRLIEGCGSVNGRNLYVLCDA